MNPASVSAKAVLVPAHPLADVAQQVEVIRDLARAVAAETSPQRLNRLSKVYAVDIPRRIIHIRHAVDGRVIDHELRVATWPDVLVHEHVENERSRGLLDGGVEEPPRTGSRASPARMVPRVGLCQPQVDRRLGPDAVVRQRVVNAVALDPRRDLDRRRLAELPQQRPRVRADALAAECRVRVLRLVKDTRVLNSRSGPKPPKPK